MSFRRRITLVSAAAVAIAVVLASLLVYLLTSNQLHSQVDNQLRAHARETERLKRLFAAANIKFNKDGSASIVVKAPRVFAIAAKEAESDIDPSEGEDAATKTSRDGYATHPLYGPTAESLHTGSRPGSLFGSLPPNPQQVRGYQQVVESNGRVLARSVPGVTLPVDASTLALARHGGEPFLRDASVKGVHMRILVTTFGSGRAVELALPLSEVDSLLSRLRLILALVLVGGIALAALLGRLVAGAVVTPLKRLTQTTEHVARTRDLSGRIAPAGEDEIGRLATSFNAMLDALEQSMGALDESVHAQRQLVADASHELRTPVTSIRTNIEILQQQCGHMEAEDQSRLLGDVVEQIEDLSHLVNDLIDLARGEEPYGETEDVRLDLLVEEVVERARRTASPSLLRMELEPTVISGVPARLERAVSNLLDNAVKYSPPGQPVEIVLQGEELTVRDHGPGISAEDLPHVFDRFYRGAEARGRPGSGLGLAIVRQVAGQHGGSVAAEAAQGGGTLMRLRLPGAEGARAEPELAEAQPVR